MTTLRRATERLHHRRRNQDLWLTFNAGNRADPLTDGFGALASLGEERLAPGAGVLRQPYHDAEIITYVREGGLAYDDSTGASGVIHAGEFQRMIAGGGLRHSQTNASRTEGAHFFQIRLRSSEAGSEPGHEQQRFSAAERRGGLCVVASNDGRRRSLRIHQDALVYSAMLGPGQHVVHELTEGRSAWLHVVRGEVIVGDIVLTTGDGLGVAGERAVSLTAREESEILLLDLGVTPARRSH
jgi:quercetin 2,3-dioxygenase